MRSKGFTLVELLAVLLILAIIALIVVPQILHIIEESKIESIRISASNYIRAVNTAIMSEEMSSNIIDGVYIISDNGKTIKYNDKKINIEYDGSGIESGMLVIEDNKVKSILKGRIDEYYAKLENDSVSLYSNIEEIPLTYGQGINSNIKNLVGDTTTETEPSLYKILDTKVKEITFLQFDMLPKGYTKEELIQLPTKSLAKGIDAYYDEEHQVVYIYSDSYIYLSGRLSWMFNKFNSLEEINFNGIEARNLTNTSLMFNACENLKKLDLRTFETESITSYGGMFGTCYSLDEVLVTHGKWTLDEDLLKDAKAEEYTFEID